MIHPRFSHLVNRFPELSPLLPDLQTAFDTLRTTFANGGKVLLCGNGGSAADCEHIAAELVNKFELARPIHQSHRDDFAARFGSDGEFLAAHLQGALPAISLVSQTALMTALANDVAAEFLFAQQVWTYGNPNDCLWAISTSGNSGNVLHALRVAHLRGLKTLGLSGKGGGTMNELCDVNLVVPRTVTAEIQELHLPIYHAMCGALETEFFG